MCYLLVECLVCVGCSDYPDCDEFEPVGEMIKACRAQQAYQPAACWNGGNPDRNDPHDVTFKGVGFWQCERCEEALEAQTRRGS